MKKIFLILITALISVLSVHSFAEQKRETVAVFVRNASDNKAIDKCLSAFEGALCSRINEAGFSAMNRNVIISELNKYQSDASAERQAVVTKIRKMLEGKDFNSDSIYNSASMLNIAKMLGADYILDAQISSLATDSRTFTDFGTTTKTNRLVMRSSYNLYEAGSGAGAAGKSLKSENVIRQSPNLSIDDADATFELVDSIAQKIATELVADKKASGGFIAKKETTYPVQIYCFIEGMKFPHIVCNEKGEYLVSTDYIPAEANGVTIILDGAAIGSAQNITDERNNMNQFVLPSGIHQMRVERGDLIPFERMVNVSPNMKMFSVYLQMTDAARERWKTDSAFFESLKRNSKLTDAQVELIKGMADTYKNSGFKIDYKTDTKEPIKIQQNSSILPAPSF